MNTFRQLNARLSRVLLGFSLATAFLSLNTGCDERGTIDVQKVLSGQSAKSLESTMWSNLAPAVDTVTSADARHPALGIAEIKPAFASAQELDGPSFDIDRQ